MGIPKESSSSKRSGDLASGDENPRSEPESTPRPWSREEMEGAEGFPIPEVPDDLSNAQDSEETNDD